MPAWNDVRFAARRLTRAAYRALATAALEAGAGPVTPQGVFDVLARAPTSVATRALEVAGATWRELGVPSVVTSPPADEQADVPLLLTPSAQALFEHASEEASRRGQHPVSTGHLVLAILAEAAGGLPADAPLGHRGFGRALDDVLGRPWAHGYALDGEHVLYVTRDEALVLFGRLLRREGGALHPAEAVVLGDLRELLRPGCTDLLAGGPEALDAARRRVAALGRVVSR